MSIEAGPRRALGRHVRPRPGFGRGKRSLRVLLVVENVPLAKDHRLRKQAASLRAAGYEVTVICQRDPGNFGIAGIRVEEYAPPREASSRMGFVREYAVSLLKAGWLTMLVFLTSGFDAMQVSGTPDIYFLIGGPFKLLGRPLVLDQRDPAPELYEARFHERGLTYAALSWLERMSYWTADHVIVVNQSVLGIACTRGRRSRTSVTVVGNGPLLSRTARRPAQEELRKGRRHLCCWIGLMGPQDRVDLALYAVSHLVHVRRRIDAHFAFVGDGEARASSERLSLVLGIEKWVTFTGWLEEDDAFTYLSSSDLGLEPNLQDIVSPVKAMEYMAFRLPFVAFDLKETRALGGDAACYAAPADVAEFARLVDELLSDELRRARMGAAGRQRVEQEVAWDHQQMAYTRVFERLIGPPPDTEPRRARRARRMSEAVGAVR